MLLYRELQQALRPGNSPEQVYRVLYFLLREDRAIKKLEQEFKKKDSRNLQTALTERFGQSTLQLNYALQLIGKEYAHDGTRTYSIINCMPGPQAECIALSKVIHDALLLQRNFEKVYRALTPFQHNTELLCRFNTWYKTYKQSLNIGSQADTTGLQADMRRHLTGDSLKFGLFLIGDRDLETKVVSLSEAERLSKMALQQTFERKDGKRVPIPYEAAGSNGSQCLFRAHVLAEALTELGYGVEKIYMYSIRANMYNQKYGGFGNSAGNWWYHTACCMQVKTDSGIEVRILDPSGSLDGTAPRDLDKPMLWTIEEWMAQSGKPDSYEFITFEALQRLMERQRQQYQNVPENILDHYPAGQTYVFTTDRNYVGMPTLETIERVSKFTDMPNQYSNAVYYQQGLEMITESTGWITYCRTYQDINKEIQQPTIHDDESAKGFLEVIKKIFGATMNEFHMINSSTGFSGIFPKSYQNFIAHLKARNVSQAMIAHFEKYLFGYYEGLSTPLTNPTVQLGTAAS